MNPRGETSGTSILRLWTPVPRLDAEVVSFDVDSAEPYPAGREAAGSRTPGLQVVDALVKPVQDLAVAGGQGHVELGSWLSGRLVEDGVDEPPSGAGW